jgi:hypothetical protein
MTFVSTDAGKFWTNKAALDDIMRSTDKLFAPEYVNKQVVEKRFKFDDLLAKFKVSKDDSKLKSALNSLGEKMKDSTKFNTEVEAASNKQTHTDKINSYEKVINSQFVVMKGGTGKLQPNMGQPMIATQPTKAETDILIQETEVLRQYEKQYMFINNKLTYFNSDAKYVNVTLALTILLFGSYFCVTILDNSRRYQNMLSSGGIFGGKDCL